MDESRAWNYCLWLLSRRAYSEAELLERMQRKETEPETARRVLDRLRDYGFVDDAEFTGQFVRSRSSRYGRLRLRGDLLRRGIDEELVETGLAPLSDEEQEAAAFSLLERNAWRFQRSSDARRERARAWAFLARRGFPPPAVSAAVERFGERFGLDADDEDPPDFP